MAHFQTLPGYNQSKHRGIQLFITVEIEELHLRNPGSGATGTKKTDYEIDLDPTWSIARLHGKVKEDIMVSGLAVKDHTLIDQLRPYCLENGIFTPLIGTKTPSEQMVKPGAHLLFTRAPKETLDAMKYQPDGRPRRAEA